MRDGTLGSTPAGVVAPGLDDLGTADYLIRADLGEQRDRNLFHSFKLFSIGRGERATFTDEGAPDPGAIENVISRVTGDERSEIHGVLHSTIPGADVWLLNPNGVVFGAGAELDVEGSFHASTADSLDFDTDGLERFYSDLSRESVLSTATPLAFGFLSEKGAALLAVDRGALEVPDGETLELAGGDVSLTLAEVAAPGGDVRLDAQGEVRISQSLVDVNSGDVPGTISIRGGKIVVEKSSLVSAENESSVPPAAEEAAQPGPGSISLEARKSVLVDASLLSVSTHGAGNAGTIDIQSPEVTLQQGLGLDHPDRPQAPHRIHAGASAETTGSGAAGRIEIESTPSNASDLTTVTVANGAGLSAQTVGVDAAAPASGAGGTVRIVGADEVRVADRGFVTVESWGSTGDAGSIEILDVGALEVDGDWLTTLTASSLASVSRFSLFDASREQTPAKAGAIRIDANSVDLLRGGAIQSRCLDCAGGRGEIHVTAQDLTADGRGGVVPNRNTNARVHWGVGSHIDATTFGGEGDAGRIAIRSTGNLKITGGAQVTANSLDGATGNAGDISIEAGDVRIERMKGDEVFRPSLIAVEAAEYLGSPSQGDAGHIQIEADSLVLKSDPSLGPWNSGITAHSLLGSAGSIALDVRSIEIDNGSINAATRGAGMGGTIEIGADSMHVSDGGSIDAGTSGAGNAGAIEIDAHSLELHDGGQILARGAAGNGGSVVIDAYTVQIGPGRETGKEGPGIFVTSNGTGNAGSVEITARDWIRLDDAKAPRLDLEPILDGEGGFFTGIVSGTTFGAGGPITLDAPEITVSNGALIASSSVRGLGGGEIKLTGKNIRVEQGGFITGASFFTPFKAGDVSLVASESIEVSGQNFYGDPSQVTSSTLGPGAAGAVTLDAPRILVDGGAVSTVAVPLRGFPDGGAAGEITLDGGRVIVRNGGRVTATTMGPGDGGTIDILADESIRVEGKDSSIASRTGADGTGGDVVLSAPRIDIASGGTVSAESTHGLGELGAIVDFFRDFIEEHPGPATGDAGNVTIGTETARVKTLRVVGGRIATSAEAPTEDVDAGKIAIHVDHIVHLDAGEITASVNGGAGGNIEIDPEVVILENGSRIEATAAGGSGGNIRIIADNYFAFPGSEVSAEADRQDLSGTIELLAPDVDLAGNLTELPNSYLDASSLMRERCAARRSGEASGSFAVRGVDGIPPEPDGWLRASVEADTDTTAEVAPALPILGASLSGPLLAAGTCE